VAGIATDTHDYALLESAGGYALELRLIEDSVLNRLQVVHNLRDNADFVARCCETYPMDLRSLENELQLSTARVVVSLDR
jgi:hypothetical protein